MDLSMLQTVDAYIDRFPADVQAVLQQIRRVIKQAIPDAEETIKYQMPTFSLKGNLVSFAAYKNHIGVYPIPAGDETFQVDISVYRSGKSTARFPLDQPVPYELIGRLAAFRMQEKLSRSAVKQK